MGVRVGFVVGLADGEIVAVSPTVGLGPGVLVYTSVAEGVGGCGVSVGTAADRARVGRFVCALVGV